MKEAKLIRDAMRDAARHVNQTVDVDGWTARLNLVSDPTRLRILLTLHYLPGLTVNDVARVARVTPTTVSQSLRRPRDLGWVVSDREGRLQRYRLVDDRLHALLHTMGGGHYTQEPAPPA